MSPVFCTRHLSEYSITWTQLRLDVVGNEEFDIWSARVHRGKTSKLLLPCHIEMLPLEMLRMPASL
ncbi:hypothetical protein WG66_006096 [Moniliophthora roreri]|nr:hypothetical protein WG66_006096 [Moniliophthora roreri]